MTSFRNTDDVRSWGGILKASHALAVPGWSDELPALIRAARQSGETLLATGLRRSYGTSGLNPGGCLIDMTGLDRIISFDPETRLLEAEAGLSLADVAGFAIPKGLFLPVTPGTRFVTLGGAVANDVHGKNHHRNGTIGRWVKRIRLLRTDGSQIELAPGEPTGLFSATIGGLGLTGVITHVTIELAPIAGTLIEAETIAFSGLAEFFDLARDSEARFEHTVAWVDCLATGRDLGRGIFIRGNHAAQESATSRLLGRPKLSVPLPFPGVVLNRHVMKAFNALYFQQKARQQDRRLIPLASFFYPLDSIAKWNLIYGKQGFYQYQSVVPPASEMDATREMLRAISEDGQGSFLAVLKTFGAIPSPGLLSFPLEGTTLALDFPNRGESTLRLLARLDDIVSAAGGRLYPAKDGRMPARLFHAGYPRLAEFSRHVDPGISSAFWEQVKNG